MATNIIILIASVVFAISSVVWIILSIIEGKRIDKIELVLCGHATHIHDMRRTIHRMEREISRLEIRLNELDNKTTDDSSGGTGESD